MEKNVLEILRADHRTVEELFSRFEKAGPRAEKTKAEVSARVIELLSVHASVEEQVLYPFVRDNVPDMVSTALESLEEHHVAKLLLRELDSMTPSDERFTPKMTVLIENVRHHVQEEEDEMFPAIEKACEPDELERLGEVLEQAKKVAPTRPHPLAPDTPPANLVVGAVSALVDRVITSGRELVGVARGR